MQPTFENLRRAVRESGKERDLLAFSFRKFPVPQNGGCGASTYVEGTNGGKMPCGNMLKKLDGTKAPYYCAVCQPGRK